MGFEASEWLRLAEAVEADPETTAEVALAATDPEEYFAQFRERLWERGIGAVDEVDPLIALVDGLMDRGRLVEFDWKEADEAVVEGLVGLQQSRDAGVSIPVQDLAGVEEALPYANEILNEYGLSVIGIDIGSDSYPTTIVPTENVAAVRLAAEPVQVPIKSWGVVTEVDRAMTARLHWDEDAEELLVTVDEWDDISKMMARLERGAPEAQLRITADPPVGGIRTLHVSVEGAKRDAFGWWNGSPTHVTVAELDDPRKGDQVHRTSSAIIRYQILRRFVAGQAVNLEDWEPRWGDE
jgi:hypothetical protein